MDKTNDKGLETLQVWQRSLEFASSVCKDILPQLPAQEKWALANQLRRSAQSIPANIAEGYGRFYFQESVRFCYIARGSLEEVFSHLTLAYRLEYISDETYKILNAEIQELRRMLNGYIAFLKPANAARQNLAQVSPSAKNPPHMMLISTFQPPQSLNPHSLSLIPNHLLLNSSHFWR